jgi:hypothetical protein
MEENMAAVEGPFPAGSRSPQARLSVRRVAVRLESLRVINCDNCDDTVWREPIRDRNGRGFSEFVFQVI